MKMLPLIPILIENEAVQGPWEVWRPVPGEKKRMGYQPRVRPPQEQEQKTKCDDGHRSLVGV